MIHIHEDLPSVDLSQLVNLVANQLIESNPTIEGNNMFYMLICDDLNVVVFFKVRLNMCLALKKSSNSYIQYFAVCHSCFFFFLYVLDMFTQIYIL